MSHVHYGFVVRICETRLVKGPSCTFRYAPAISVRSFSGLLSSDMFTLPAR